MKRARHTPERIIRKLREADADPAKGTSILEVRKILGISENTYFYSRRDFTSGCFSHHDFSWETLAILLRRT